MDNKRALICVLVCLVGGADISGSLCGMSQQIGPWSTQQKNTTFAPGDFGTVTLFSLVFLSVPFLHHPVMGLSAYNCEYQSSVRHWK